MHHPLNLRVLQRHDPTITDIVDSTSYAVLYDFQDDRWHKTGKEGTLFIYERSVPTPRPACFPQLARLLTPGLSVPSRPSHSGPNRRRTASSCSTGPRPRTSATRSSRRPRSTCRARCSCSRTPAPTTTVRSPPPRDGRWRAADEKADSAVAAVRACRCRVAIAVSGLWVSNGEEGQTLLNRLTE